MLRLESVWPTLLGTPPQPQTDFHIGHALNGGRVRQQRETLARRLPNPSLERMPAKSSGHRSALTR
jgi:hypothetical protein